MTISEQTLASGPLAGPDHPEVASLLIEAYRSSAAHRLTADHRRGRPLP